MDSYHRLVGKSERVGLVKYEVTDATIQILGPAHWRLYVAWVERALGGLPESRETYTEVHEEPDMLTPAEDVLAIVRRSAQRHTDEAVAALKASAKFISDHQAV